MEIDHLEDLDEDVRIILKWIIKKWDGEAGTGLVWLRVEIAFGFNTVQRIT
jgi:hypothetical protein